MSATLNDCCEPIMTPGERRVASRLVDHWPKVYHALATDPKLCAACRRLLRLYAQDMIQRIGLLS